jgi:uncharacterized protein YcfL
MGKRQKSLGITLSMGCPVKDEKAWSPAVCTHPTRPGPLYHKRIIKIKVSYLYYWYLSEL